MTRQGCNGGARGAVAAPLRHCEARSAVAIHAVVRPPMDCFRHCEERSDVAIIAMTGQGRNDTPVVIARRAAPWQSSQ
jgi:hypothetical protein